MLTLSLLLPITLFLSPSLGPPLIESQELDDKNALNILLCSVKIPSSYASADNDKRFEIMNPAKKHSIVLQVSSFFLPSSSLSFPFLPLLPLLPLYIFIIFLFCYIGNIY